METSTLASWLLIGGYVTAIVALVVRGARRNQSVRDYAVGSLAFSPVAVGLALAASTTSAATFIINPGLVAYFGLSAVFALCVVLPISMSVSLVVLTKGFRRYGDSIKAMTLSQWVGQRYRSRGFAIFFAFLSLLLVTFIVMILVGLTKVIAASLGLSEIGVLAALTIFSFGYMMFGGANSMVYTNTIQAIVMVVVAVILLGSGWHHFSQGISGFVDALGAVDPNLTTLYNPSSPLFRDGFEVVFCTMMVGAAIVCQPHIITKSLLLRHDDDLNRYLATGIVIQTLFFFVVVVGLYARLEFPTLQAGGQTIPPDGVVSTYLVTQFPWFVGVVVFLGLISAGMSTLEGLIQSLSITITNDLIGNVHHLVTRRQLGDSFLFLLNRVVIVGLAALSFALAYQQILSPNLSVIIFAQLGVYAYFAAAFVPVLFGTFLRDTPAIAAIAASVTAVVVHFTLYYTGQGYFPYYQGVTVKNPGISTALGIAAAVLVGGALYFTFREKHPPEGDLATAS
ncbi:MAG: sodium:solute symporter [Thermoanaerobaculia bacterium]|nr:sodium:solute symporter [Thermoanaerobaculia bacterium]